MDDPFMPDWSQAPDWAEWHAYDQTGQGTWFPDGKIGTIEPNSDPGVWYVYEGTDDWSRLLESGLSITGDYDWRNTLRHRPDMAG